MVIYILVNVCIYVKTINRDDEDDDDDEKHSFMCIKIENIYNKANYYG